MRYLLGTNIVSALVRDPDGPVTQRIRLAGAANVCTSVIVAAEPCCGAAKKGSARLCAQVETVLGAIEVLPLEAPADATYGEVRAHLERAGRSIGGNDLLIAAHATRHERHPRRRDSSRGDRGVATMKNKTRGSNTSS